MKIQKVSYEPVEPGVYTGTIQDVSEAEGRFGLQLRFTIALDGEDSYRLVAWCNPVLSPKSKLFRWVRAIMGEVPDVLDTNSLIGKPCRVTVSTRQGENGEEFNRIDDILPPRTGQKARPRPEPEAEIEEIPF
jgi:hypothetical protein